MLLPEHKPDYSLACDECSCSIPSMVVGLLLLTFDVLMLATDASHHLSMHGHLHSHLKLAAHQPVALHTGSFIANEQC